jgi:hypothetical protein
MAANGITDTEANAILDARIESGSTVALVTTMGTATSAGTKVTGGSYADGTPTWGSAASRSKAISAVLNYTGMPDTTSVTGVKGIDIYHPSAGARSWFMPLAANKITGAGDTLSFAIGAISAGFVNGT